MNENLHNIDKLFKEAIEQHEEPPSEKVWDAVDKNLDKSKVVSISRKYNKLKWAVAALFLFSFGLAMYTWHIRMKNKELVKQNNLNKPHTHPSVKSLEKHADNDFETTRTSPEKPKVNAADQKAVNDKLNSVAQNTDRNTDQTATDNLKNEPAPTQKITRHPLALNDNFNASHSKNTGKNPAQQSVVNDRGVTNHKANRELVATTSESTSPAVERSFSQISLLPQSHTSFSITPIQGHITIPAIPETIEKNADLTMNNDKTTSPKNNKAKQKKLSPLSATVFVAPDIIFASVKNDHPRFREDDRDEIKNNEHTKSSYSAGLLLGYSIGKVTIQSGVSLFTRVTDIKPQTIYARPDNNGNVSYRINCSAGPSYISLKSGSAPSSGDSAQAASAKNTLQYISIPLMAKYKLGKSRLSFTPGVGIAVNVLSKGKTESVISKSGISENTATDDIQGLKSNYFSGTINLGAEYKVSRSLSLEFNTLSAFALSSINNDAPVKTKLNSIGLSAGITFKF